jgi:uncharacterized phage-associated protein
MLKFDERKATEATALLLSLRGGQMHYMKLIKLLYLADRRALLRWGIPITTDTYTSMDHGPVVSTIYNLIRRLIKGQTWEEYISPPMGDANKEIALQKQFKLSRLSRAEEKLIKEVFNKYGHWNRYKLRDFVMHKLPDWHDPEGTSIPISISDILKAGGEKEEEIKAIEKELNGIGKVEDRFSRV